MNAFTEGQMRADRDAAEQIRKSQERKEKQEKANRERMESAVTIRMTRNGATTVVSAGIADVYIRKGKAVPVTAPPPVDFGGLRKLMGGK